MQRPNYPVTDATAAADATQVIRLGVDGSSGSYSFQSANFPEQYLTPLDDGYLYFDSFWNTIQGTALRRGTWDMLQQPDGSYIMTSHSPLYNNVTVGVITYASTRTCGDNGNTNMRASAALTPLRINIVDALMSASSECGARGLEQWSLSLIRVRLKCRGADTPPLTHPRSLAKSCRTPPPHPAQTSTPTCGRASA